MEKLGIKRMFDRLALDPPRMKLPWTAIITGMIMNRFMGPCSKQRLNDEQWEQIYPEFLGKPVPFPGRGQGPSNIVPFPGRGKG